MPINYTYKNNIKKDGETVSGSNMYGITDNKGEFLSKMYGCGFDYELATFYIDWINEGNTKPYGMKELIEIIKQKEK